MRNNREHVGENTRTAWPNAPQRGMSRSLGFANSPTSLGNGNGCSLRQGVTVVEAVKDLSGQGLSDAENARVLNMKAATMPQGKRWSQDRVKSFRRTHHIKAVTDENAEEYLTGKQVAERLGISRNGVLGLLRVGALHNHQVTDFAPWRIPRSEVESAKVKKLVDHLKKTGRLPPQGGCPERQLSLTHEK